MALGAAPRRVLGLVVRQGLGPVAIGGVIAAVAAGSTLAFWIPARRATAIQPGSALRGE